MEKRYDIKIDLKHKKIIPDIEGYINDNITLAIEVCLDNKEVDLGDCNVMYKIIKPNTLEEVGESQIIDKKVIVEIDNFGDVEGLYNLYIQISRGVEKITSYPIKFRLNKNPFDNSIEAILVTDIEGNILTDVDGNILSVRG